MRYKITFLDYWHLSSGLSSGAKADSTVLKDKDGIIADGSIRSGKTVSMSLSYVIWAMSNFTECNFGMCGKTIGSFRRNVLNILKKIELTKKDYFIQNLEKS